MQHEKGLHSSLDFENRRVQTAQMQMDFVNNVIWACDEKFGSEFVRDKIYTYGCGIEFKELTESEYRKVKVLVQEFCIKKVGKYKKESNKWGLQISAFGIIGEIPKQDWDGKTELKEIDCTICFKWGLPDTCELIEVSKTEEVRDPVYTDKNGRTFREVTSTEVKCSKPILEAVFAQQKDEPVNV